MLSRAACISRGTWRSFDSDPAGALGQRRVVEQHLAGKAGGDQVAVVLRIALPGTDGLQLEQAGADVRLERRPLEPLESVSRAGSIAASRRAKPPERPDLRVDRRPTQVLQQIVMKVDAVECRVGGMHLVQPREVLVDEVGQGFGGIHSGRIGAPRMSGILYVVATPIGNLEDVTLRALRILREVSLIAAEDTRRTGRLLQHYSISTRTTSLHEHNEREKTPRLVERLLAGESIALVSDAGTPLISDPGQRSSRPRERRECGSKASRDPAPSWPRLPRRGSRPASSRSSAFHH